MKFIELTDTREAKTLYRVGAIDAIYRSYPDKLRTVVFVRGKCETVLESYEEVRALILGGNGAVNSCPHCGDVNWRYFQHPGNNWREKE